MSDSPHISPRNLINQFVVIGNRLRIQHNDILRNIIISVSAAPNLLYSLKGIARH